MGAVDKRNRGMVRQWRLLRALQKSQRGMTFQQLREAAEERVCERTIRRDVDTLELAGFPIDVVSGEHIEQTKVYLRDWTVN